MNLHISPAPVRKTIIVTAGIERAFAVFTGKMGNWWPKSHSINKAAAQTDVVIEPKAQGRWYERGADGSECPWGYVITWEPPRRLLLAWQLSADWTYDPALITELEIRFTPEGADATRIDLEHRNLDRYGDQADKVRTSIDGDNGWSGLLKAYADTLSS